ncbi:SRPBCC family protein [Gelidibacter salicanalis]|uniref:SRPBCC family protein n=1 Tax=Gelidibacter salicanalis TaxID=291193 RepID=A0A934KTR0_9FLAO|nr:SRPBCC family protein [Gelidibacter salicanalis]MBJ7880542.1 SRPBCC family protein [Gelidibacter salicanalis]
MTYSLDIIIEAPISECTEKFITLHNRKHWQRGLLSIEHISGTPRSVGSKMKMQYLLGKHQMALMETITHKNLPHQWHATYTTDGMDTIQENYFKTTPENYTQWTSINTFLPLNFKMRLMIYVMPRALKKQSLQYMKDFKTFVEKGISVADA